LQKPTKADGVKKETEGSVLDNKIRSTRMLYKRFKSCLADFLKRDEGTSEDTTDPSLPRLLQSLYDKFQVSFVEVSNKASQVEPFNIISEP